MKLTLRYLFLLMTGICIGLTAGAAMTGRLYLDFNVYQFVGDEPQGSELIGVEVGGNREQKFRW